MKYAFLILFLGSINLFGQSLTSDSIQTRAEELYTIVEMMPSPPDGMENLYKWISKTVKYPASARRIGVEGTVFVGFVVRKDGSITDVKTVESVDYALDRESERVIGLMPNWNPGKKDGKAVNVSYVLPVKFKLVGPGPSPDVSKVTVGVLTDSVRVFSNDVAADSEHVLPDVMPDYPGGLEGFYRLIAKDIRYPSDARVLGVEGIVYVEFIVTWQGEVTNVWTTRGVTPSMNTEAERVVRNAATSVKWKPGELNGKPINAKFVLPVKFKIMGSERWVLYERVSEMPTYPGGDEAMQKRIKKHLTYPINAKRSGVTGTVLVEFVVERNGSLSNVRTLQGVNPDLNAEAERVVKLFPRLNPGKQDSVPVRVIMVVPIEFKLDHVATNIQTRTVAETSNTHPVKTVANASAIGQSRTIAEASFTEDDTLVYATAEVMPEYSQGVKAMYEFISSNIIYPDEAKRYGQEGTVYVGFVVSKTGTVRNRQIVKGVSPSLNVEAMRVVGLLTSWKPGMQSGEAVNVKFVLPIKFRLAAMDTNIVPFDPNAPDAVFTFAEHMPQYPGGAEALKKQIEADLKSSGVVKVKRSRGVVLIRFIVERDGSLSNFEIVTGINDKYNKEAERVVRNLPKFKPGMNKGQTVRVSLLIGVEIK